MAARGRSLVRSGEGSDAAALSLDGAWRFHLAASVEAVTKGLEQDGFDDRGWDGEH
jgi:beta-galactosidase